MEGTLQQRSRIERRRTYDEIRRGVSLEEALTQLARCAEQCLPHLKCSILLLDEEHQRLRHGAAPSLPAAYTRAVDGLKIGPSVGSCGAAAFHGRRVIVEDVRSHPNWEPFRELAGDLARDTGLISCWSEPVLLHGELVGTVAFYGTESEPPEPQELEFLQVVAQFAAATIERQLRVGDSASGDGHPKVAENVHVVFWMFDVEKRVVSYVSPAFESVWGRSCGSLYDTADVWRESLHPEDQNQTVTAFERSTETGHLDEEYRIVRPSGDVRWIHERSYPLRSDQDRLRCIVGLSEDVTNAKEFEQRLRESEASFRQLAENIGAVFWLTDWRERRMLYVSPSWEQIWGQSVDCLYDDDPTAWASNIHEEDRERVLRNFRAQAESGEYDEDFRVVHEDGTVHWLHERAFPIRDESGRVYRVAGVAEDITARKRVERELAQARDEIEDMRRSQVQSLTSELLLAEENERRRLAQDLHDGMNQLITLALLKLAQLRDRTSGDAQGLATEIESIVEKAGQETRSLTYQLSPPILHDLGFEPALQWLAEDVQRNYGLEVELNEEEQYSPLDERVRILLFRAVRELLINVAKHAQATRVRLHSRRHGDQLLISVEDDGVAFDPEAVGNRGVGLYGIRERLGHLGGEMNIDSRTGVGTRITLEAPLNLPDNTPS